jgi:hypothetical protein
MEPALMLVWIGSRLLPLQSGTVHLAQKAARFLCQELFFMQYASHRRICWMQQYEGVNAPVN